MLLGAPGIATRSKEATRGSFFLSSSSTKAYPCQLVSHQIQDRHSERCWEPPAPLVHRCDITGPMAASLLVTSALLVVTKKLLEIKLKASCYY